MKELKKYETVATKETHIQNQLFTVGKIVNTHGLKGELKIYQYTSDKTDFEEFEYILVKQSPLLNDDNYYRLNVEWVRYVKNMVLIKLLYLNDINDVLPLKDKDVFYPRNEYLLPEEGSYFITDLIGLEVYNGDSKIGKIKDVLQNTTQDIYVISTENNNDVMIPAVKEFIKNVDIEGGRMDVEVIEGLI